MLYVRGNDQGGVGFKCLKDIIEICVKPEGKIISHYVWNMALFYLAQQCKDNGKYELGLVYLKKTFTILFV